MKIVVIIAIFLLIIAPAQAEEWGNFTGRFVYDGKAPDPHTLNINKDVEICEGVVDESLVVDEENGGLANVVIWVRTKDVEVHPDYAKSASDEVFIETKRCRFDPHIVVYRTAQPLVLLNSDPVCNNVKVELINNPPLNLLLAADSTEELKPLKLAEPIPVRVLSNLHRSMLGMMVVRPNPYAAVSAVDGKFEIKNLPAGTELEFQVWHERTGFLQKATVGGKDAGWKRGRFKVRLQSGDNELGEIKLDPAQFKD